MSNITRYDPFGELVDDLFKGFFVRPMGFEQREAVAPRIKVDVAERNGAYLVTAEVPGVKKEDIHVSVDGSQVTHTIAGGQMLMKDRQVLTLDEAAIADKAAHLATEVWRRVGEMD